MKRGYLSEYFLGVMAKRLSAVETDPEKSNQHELNGVSELKVLLGEGKLQDVPTTFLWISDDGELQSENSSVTWYDAREKNKTRSEFRLYFKPNTVMSLANERDILIVAKKQSGDLIIVVASNDSSAANRLLWLFGLSSLNISNRFSVRHVENGNDRQLRLNHIGIALAAFEGRRLVSAVLDGSPASKAGLRRGDQILAVNGEPYHPVYSFNSRPPAAEPDRRTFRLLFSRGGAEREAAVAPVFNNLFDSYRDAVEASAGNRYGQD